jgi:hypothetical protein
MPSADLTPGAPPHAPVAVILPGSGYTILGPLLYWSARLLEQGGWRVRAVEWDPNDLKSDDPQGFIEAEVEAAFAAAPPTGTRLVLAKSLGTFAAPWALANNIAGVWLTPVLSVPAVSTALRDHATDRDLVVGGTADPLWRPETIVGTAATVLEMPRADHALVVPGDHVASRMLHEHVFDAVERHLAGVRNPRER